MKCIHRPTVPVSIIIIAKPFSSINGVNGLDCPTPVALPPPEVKVTTKHRPFGFFDNQCCCRHLLPNLDKIYSGLQWYVPSYQLGGVFIEYGLNHGPFVSSRESVDPCGGSYQVCYVEGDVIVCYILFALRVGFLQYGYGGWVRLIHVVGLITTI